MKDWRQYLLAMTITLGFFALIFVLIWMSIPNANRDLMNLAVGSLIGSFSTVVGYFFGSSQGSAKKTETIDKIVDKNDKTGNDK